jgi:hypothetical protein
MRSLLLAADHRGLVARRDHARASPLGERGGRAGVVVMAVGEQDVVDAHARLERGEQLEDRVLLARRGRLDQVEPVPLAHRVRLDHRCAQAPQPIGDSLELHDYETASAGCGATATTSRGT